MARSNQLRKPHYFQAKVIWIILLLPLLIVIHSFQPRDANTSDCFKIRVVDSETGRGVPMVGLIPLSRQKYYTDSNGFIAFNEPGLMDRKVYFEIHSEGFRYPMGKDGRRAVSLLCKAGDSALVEVVRTNVAERLYRSTGLGIYRDSYLLGESIPIDRPLLNAQILGQDSNLATLYKGKLFWIWGDSFLPSAYHGNFSVATATSEFPSKGGLNPEIGINYTYITDEEGAAKPMIHLGSPGYVWFDWLINIKGEGGQEQLVAKYANVNSFFQNYERGVAIYDDEKRIFESVKQVDEWMPYGHRCEHPFMGKSKAQEYVYLTSEFDFQRVVPQLDSLMTPTSYESFTCLKKGTKFDLNHLQLERNAQGELVYGWKKNTGFVDIKRQQQLIDAGKIKESESWTHLTDIETGEKANVHRGSIFWNNYRKKWILISGATDTWYSEADTPVGPWVYARKVAEHKSFLYNPTQHPFFDQKGGAEVFFEGTFTKFFSKEEIVPYYDYNQMFYKLSLENEQTFLPSPVYRLSSGYLLKENLPKAVTISDILEIPFFAMAPDRKIKGQIPVYVQKDGALSLEKENDEPLFYALPPEKNRVAPFSGTWESKIEFSAFDNSFVLGISEVNGNLKLSADKSNFKLSEASIKSDTVYFKLEHTEGIYRLKATVAAGQLTGSWTQENSDYEGAWEGYLKSKEKWWGQFSASVVPLFEYHNQGTGEYLYVTDSNYVAPGFSKSNTPLCRVWRNPIKQPILDFDTEPIPTPSIY